MSTRCGNHRDSNLMQQYGVLPKKATLKPTPFKVHIAEEKLQLFTDLVRLSPVAPAVYENSNTKIGRRYGVRRDWVAEAKEVLSTSFSWRKFEERINRYPNFRVALKDDEDLELNIHFVALFSKRQDVTPIILYHGWPGTFVDFLEILDRLAARYTPETMPYHIVVPSLPGTAFSSGPTTDVDYSLVRAAYCLDSLMLGLGLDHYIAHGGGLGAGIANIQALAFSSCEAFHVNTFLMAPPVDHEKLYVDEEDKNNIRRCVQFLRTGMAYASEHGTRPATTGLTLQASPIAMLSWVGEKYLEWSDEDPPLEKVLETVALYWLTESIPRGLYAFRKIVGGPPPRLPFIEKPFGYSTFPKDVMPVPVSWAATTAKLVFFKKHTSGGRFPAIEKPRLLLEDIEAFVKAVHPASSPRKRRASSELDSPNSIRDFRI
ncbi:hypothetical protein CKM354_000939900 [Cercospora kikuchii]|uniref:Epoxide hydrolase N-terminal domain-containing protein n=1 Tax=Cercospora kikuchii TaxID=84275 RepID=A0A9P3CRK1_9PEZI|nr:uncharacterized protein CKM354_000939900 [Cercospora kikuchii]GIZ46267.1 hypothetical protein CKM354_000939900 [Cercospora kikuchii]